MIGYPFFTTNPRKHNEIQTINWNDPYNWNDPKKLDKI